MIFSVEETSGRTFSDGLSSDANDLLAGSTRQFNLSEAITLDTKMSTIIHGRCLLGIMMRGETRETRETCVLLAF